MSKVKGSNAERELIHMFWKEKWAAVRVAGSGSSKYPSPDIIASNNLRKIAIECKTTKFTQQYLTKKEVEELLYFADHFGAEAYIAIRFARKPWLFLLPEDLKENTTSLGISSENAERKGLSFEEIIQKRV